MNRRLDQIELSLGDYDAARNHLREAYRAAPLHTATRRLHGESLAVAGAVDMATDVWRSIRLDEQQSEIRWMVR